MCVETANLLSLVRLWRITRGAIIPPRNRPGVLLGYTEPIAQAGGMQHQIAIGDHAAIFPRLLWPTYFDCHCVATILADQQAHPSIADFLPS